ncbi:hypothetical protein DFJ77DRAFT_82546 [Powellomyces hirtus]|nr:hypothetical protein DFJ77DRAFT_82546 [Powellomyces hirtus]
MRQESDVESVGDLTCNSSSSAPGHGRKKSGFWDRLREKRGELGVSDSKNSATALARKKSLAGTVDQLTSRMRRSSASGKTLERAGSMDAARTLGGRGMTDPTFAQRARTPSPLKQIAHHPADAVDEGLLISPRRVELSDLSDGSVEGAPSRPEETGLGIFNVKVAQVAPEFMPEHLINDVQTAQSTRLAGQGSGSSRRGSQRNHESYIPQGTQLPLNRGKEEALASDSDDGESRIRGRRLKSMMGKIGRRREKGRNGSDAVSPDSHHESDMEGGAIPDDHSGAVKSRNVRDQDRGSPAPRGKKWVWDSSSSDEETRSVFDQNQSDKARGRKVGKGLSREGDTQSNGDLTEASETFKTSSRRKRAVRKFIGDRLKSASSASLVREPMDIDLQSNEGRRDSTRPGRPSNVGTDLTTSVTSADEEGDREDPGSPYSNDGARCDSVTRDPNSPFTAEEQHFYDDLMALAQRLDVLMPAAEDLKASFTHQIASRDAAIVGFEARLKPPYNRRSVQNQVLGSTDMTNEPLSMLDTSGSSIAVESLAEGQGFHRMSFSRARETGLETMLDVVKASLASLEQKCQDIEERNARSHQEVSTMVCNLDAVTQEVNEDLSRQLKMVEEAIQQIEGTPNALGSMQEWYYQLIAYVLGSKLHWRSLKILCISAGS